MKTLAISTMITGLAMIGTLIYEEIQINNDSIPARKVKRNESQI